MAKDRYGIDIEVKDFIVVGTPSKFSSDNFLIGYVTYVAPNSEKITYIVLEDDYVTNRDNKTIRKNINGQIVLEFSNFIPSKRMRMDNKMLDMLPITNAMKDLMVKQKAIERFNSLYKNGRFAKYPNIVMPMDYF